MPDLPRPPSRSESGDIVERGAPDPVAAAEALDALNVGWWDIYDAYPAQAAWVTDSDRMYQLFIGGRGTGKTWAGGHKCLWLSLLNPGSLEHDRPQYCAGGMLGRTAREIDDKIEPYFIDAIRRFKTHTGIDLVANFNGASQRYTLINGAQIYKLSYGRADALAKVRGYTFAWAYMDEIMHADVDSQKAFEIVGFTLRDPLALVPQLAATTTPDGNRGIVAHFLGRQAEGDPEHYVQTATCYDNPFLPDWFVPNLKRGCTPRQWQQEGLGRILMPTDVVYSEFSTREHVIPWTWDRELPWILCVDWGDSWGWIGAVQVVNRDGYQNRTGPPLPVGSWVVGHERLMREGSASKQREQILDLVRELGAPSMVASDRAVKQQNNWLRGSIDYIDLGLRTCKTKNEQDRTYGIGAVAYMLRPGEDDPPRLYFSRSLSQNMDAGAGTIVSGMANYRYTRRRLPGGEIVTTNRAEVNLPAVHAADAIRYAVVTSRYEPSLHGGEPLPYATAPREQNEGTP